MRSRSKSTSATTTTDHHRVVTSGKFPRGRQSAIRGAVAKWQSIAKWHREQAELPAKEQAPIELDSYQSSTCPLCVLYLYPGGSPCEGCPVREATGRLLCNGTPFEDYHDGVVLCRPHKTLAEHAEAEVKYLKGLLPKRKKAAAA